MKNKDVVIVGGASVDSWPKNYLSIFASADLIIGVDRGAWNCLEFNIYPHIAVGDFDSLSAEEFKKLTNSINEVRTAQAEKDDTDTQLALKVAIERMPDAKYTLLGVTGGRLDHFLANLWLPLEERFTGIAERIIIKDIQNDIRFLKAGKHTIKKIDKNRYCGICCLTPIKGLTLIGLKYPLTDKQVTYPFSYASNEFIGESAEVYFSSGVIAVIQSGDLINN